MKYISSPKCRERLRLLACCMLLVPLMVVLVLGCDGGENVPTDKGKTSSGSKGTRDELIAALVAKGDRWAAEGDKAHAFNAYRFAQIYAPDNPEIRAKLKSVEDHPQQLLIPAEALDHIGAVLEATRGALKNWAKAPPEMETIELRMLTDHRLVGKLDASTIANEAFDDGAECFWDQPTLTVVQLHSAYGQASGSKRYPEGERVLTYGRFRFFATNSGNITGVLFRPFLSQGKRHEPTRQSSGEAGDQRH